MEPKDEKPSVHPDAAPGQGVLRRRAVATGRFAIAVFPMRDASRLILGLGRRVVRVIRAWFSHRGLWLTPTDESDARWSTGAVGQRQHQSRRWWRSSDCGRCREGLSDGMRVVDAGGPTCVTHTHKQWVVHAKAEST